MQSADNADSVTATCFDRLNKGLQRRRDDQLMVLVDQRGGDLLLGQPSVTDIGAGNQRGFEKA